MTHLTEDDLTLLYYRELTGTEAESARAHLESCAPCRLEQENLRRLFAMVDACPVPEPGPDYDAQVWRRLQPALRAAREPQTGKVWTRVREWLVPGRGWALGGALAAVVIVAFITGRYWQPNQPEPAAVESTRTDAADIRERVLLTALGDHFDRTQGMLVELASTGPAAAVDISGEQRRAHDLLAATRIYRRAAAEAGDRGVENVLEALERVLVEVTVSPSQLSAYELQSLQKRIEQQQLLFKLRVASASVREREQSSRPAAVRGSAGA